MDTGVDGGVDLGLNPPFLCLHDLILDELVDLMTRISPRSPDPRRDKFAPFLKSPKRLMRALENPLYSLLIQKFMGSRRYRMHALTPEDAQHAINLYGVKAWVSRESGLNNRHRTAISRWHASPSDQCCRAPSVQLGSRRWHPHSHYTPRRQMFEAIYKIYFFDPCTPRHHPQAPGSRTQKPKNEKSKNSEP
jgi:hypothetical protein